MANYQEVRVKLKSTQLNKLKSAAKSRIDTILRINKKNFQNEKFATRIISNNKTNN